MRIAFMGTPDFAVPSLDALVAAGHDIAAVYCQPARRSGRGKAMRPSPVQRRAEALDIMVRTPDSLKGADQQAAFAALDLDVAIVAAYGLILPLPILAAPRLGCINVHASLLPRWRGAAPIQRAILAGDKVTGVTIMMMERGLDTGPMLAKAETPVVGKTAGGLTEELSRMGAALLPKILEGSPAKAASRGRNDRDRTRAFAGEPQEESIATYAPKIEKYEARLDFSRTAQDVERQVRAFNPPGAWFEHDGERIRVLAAQIAPLAGGSEEGVVLDSTFAIACAEGVLRPTLVQRAGRGAMTPAELLRGFAIPPGTILA